MAQDKVTALQGTMPQNIMARFPVRLKLGQYSGRSLERARTAFLPTFRSGGATRGSPPFLLPGQATHPQPATLLAMIRPHPAALLYLMAINA